MSLGYYRALMNPPTSDTPELDAVLALSLDWRFVGDAGISGGVTLSGSDLVSFNDFSGNGNDFVQFSTGLPHTQAQFSSGVITTGNNGSASYLKNSAGVNEFSFLHKLEDASIFIRMKPLVTNISSLRAICGYGRNTTSNISWFLCYEGRSIFNNMARVLSYQLPGLLDYRSDNEFFDLSYVNAGVVQDGSVYNPSGTSSPVSFYKNGSFLNDDPDDGVTINTSNPPSNFEFLLGSSEGSSPETGLPMEITKFAVCNSVASASDIAAIETWLNA
jgi:hypothetical protein